MRGAKSSVTDFDMKSLLATDSSQLQELRSSILCCILTLMRQIVSMKLLHFFEMVWIFHISPTKEYVFNHCKINRSFVGKWQMRCQECQCVLVKFLVPWSMQICSKFSLICGTWVEYTSGIAVPIWTTEYLWRSGYFRERFRRSWNFFSAFFWLLFNMLHT